MAPTPIIDFHAHAFTPEDIQVLTQRLVMMDGQLPESDPHKWQIYGEGTLEAVVRMQQDTGVESFVLLPVTGSRKKPRELNRWVADATRSYPQIIPFGTLHPHMQGLEEAVEEMKALGLKGVKLHPLIQRFSLSEPECERMLGLIEQAGLMVVVDTLHCDALKRTKPHTAWVVDSFGLKGCGPKDVAAAARAHPGITFIAAHMGGLYAWDEVGVLMELANVYFDLAWMNGLLPQERIVELIRAAGPQRVLYGTDIPWREPKAFREWFESLPLTPEEREMVLWVNAERLLEGR